MFGTYAQALFKTLRARFRFAEAAKPIEEVTINEPELIAPRSDLSKMALIQALQSEAQEMFGLLDREIRNPLYDQYDALFDTKEGQEQMSAVLDGFLGEEELPVGNNFKLMVISAWDVNASMKKQKPIFDDPAYLRLFGSASAEKIGRAADFLGLGKN